MQAWDPAALAGGYAESVLRRQELAQDPTGDMRRAWTEAERALTLARTQGEKHAALKLLAGIERDLGRRPAELAYARHLAKPNGDASFSIGR